MVVICSFRVVLTLFLGDNKMVFPRFAKTLHMLFNAFKNFRFCARKRAYAKNALFCLYNQKKTSQNVITGLDDSKMVNKCGPILIIFDRVM